MEPSMRSFLLLALTLVAVNGSKLNSERILLSEIIEDVEKILKNSSEKILDEFVKDIFPSGSCSKKNLCQAEKVLKDTHLNQTKLHRNLLAYAQHTRHHNCSVHTSVEHPMKKFLPKIKRCCKLLNNLLVK